MSEHPRPDLSGRVALVAGASKGIGADAARAFAAAGAAVVVGSRDLDRLNALVAEITDAGGRALARRTDVTDPASSQGLVDAAVTEYGRLDFAFNNATAGVNRRGRWPSWTWRSSTPRSPPTCAAPSSG